MLYPRKRTLTLRKRGHFLAVVVIMILIVFDVGVLY